MCWIRCTHYVRYEGATTMIGINIASLMMLLRIYAMYETQMFVVVFVAIIFCLEFGTNAWLLSHGIGACALTQQSLPTVSMLTMWFVQLSIIAHK